MSKELEKLLSLGKDLKVVKVEKQKDKGKIINEVMVKSVRNKARCPKCNNFSKTIHDYLKPMKIKYLDIAGECTIIIARKRRFKCKSCNKSFTEELGINNKNMNVSLRVEQKVLKDFMNKNMTIKDISAQNHISESTARNIFKKATKNYPKRIETLPKVISLDEKATYTSAGMYSLILNDPIHRITLDILKNRNKEDLIKYFKEIKNRKDVEVVIIDLYKVYKDVAKICFPRAIVVADIFHYTRYVIDALDKIRIRLMHKYENNKKSIEYYMLKNRVNKGLLLKSFSETRYEKEKVEKQRRNYELGKSKKVPKDKFNDYWYGKIKIKKNDKFIEINRIDRLQEILRLDEELNKAYNLKEEFMRILINVKYEEAKKELIEWIRKCKETNIQEIIKAAKTIENWLEEIVNSFRNEKYNNGFTEANNNVINKIIGVSYGYKNFEFFRLRALVILHKSYSGYNRKRIEREKQKNE